MSIYRGIGVSNPWTRATAQNDALLRSKSVPVGSTMGQGRGAITRTIPIHHSAAFFAAMSALRGKAITDMSSGPGLRRSYIYRIAAIAFSVWSATGQFIVMRAAWKELTASERASLGRLAHEQLGVDETGLSAAIAGAASIPVRKQATSMVLKGDDGLSPQFVVITSPDGVRLLDVTSGSRDECIAVASASSEQALLNALLIENRAA